MTVNQNMSQIFKQFVLTINVILNLDTSSIDKEKVWETVTLVSIYVGLSHSIHTYRVFIQFIKYCVFWKNLKFSGLLAFSVFPRCQCVYTHQAAALQQNWQSSGKSQNFKEKTQYLMNILLYDLIQFYKHNWYSTYIVTWKLECKF